MSLLDVSLTHKFTADRGRVFLTGTQALVRLPMMQKRIDAAAGHRTAGYVSGYRGSPLGGYDQQLAAASKMLEEHDIRFNPGVNEELAATACWGTQQAQLWGDGKFDGVFAIWYGKGPGVDRSGDAFKHGNLAGSSPLGGVIALMGDDHTCESSTTAHQSEFAMVDAMMPVLSPAGIQELVDFGLYGWALSRYSGCWVGLKCVKDVIDASGTVDVDPDRLDLKVPDDFALPRGGVHIRYPDPPLDQEARLHDVKIEAVKAFARTNRVDRVTIDAPDATLGIVTCGKSYLDVCQALRDLGLDDAEAGRLRLRLLKVGMVWPLEAEGVTRFAEGLDRIIVVEEKRALIETQLKEILYGKARAPAVEGKRDERGAPLFRSAGALDPNEIAVAIGERVLAAVDEPRLREAVERIKAIRARTHDKPEMERTPYFCSGCPHSSGTRVPEGSRAMAGIGCHFMAQWMDRNTAGYTQMGGEGASWIGAAPFVRTPHIFQNIGDGTYVHSGSLAVRAAIASGTRMTYKILFNDAVAMTGGQRLDGGPTVSQIARQMHAEGASSIAVVTDEPDKYGTHAPFPPGVTIHHRDEYLAVQQRFRSLDGVGVIIHDQTCAAEKRRRRKRGRYPDPPKRVFINDLVCEGCGDCGVESNCVSVTPLETEFGRKRTIDQSSCNKDYSCVKGFCPSFVTVVGGSVRRNAGVAEAADDRPLPEPELPSLDRPYGILVAGIGGTGVVTIGAIIGMAAHLEGKAFRGLDMAGLAQKGGAVWSHIQVAKDADAIKTARLAGGGARLVLGCDLVSAASRKTLEATGDATRMVVNTHETMTGDFTRHASLAFPAVSLRTTIRHAVGDGNARFVDASRLATALLGDSIAANMFLLGYAYQLGWIPVTAAALERAIELNGASVKMNRAALRLGRRAAVEPEAVEAQLAKPESLAASTRMSDSLDEAIARRVEFLTGYQDAAWAARYRRLVDKVRAATAASSHGAELIEAVARNFFKLMSYKDEYEVARLYMRGEFRERLEREFEGAFRLRFHLAPPLLSRRDPATGTLRKREYGPWVLHAFDLLARLKGLRGTAWDPFGRMKERRIERALIDDYESTIATLLQKLDDANFAVVLRIARIPEEIRGFGHVKERNLAAAKRKEAALLAELRATAPAAREPQAAAEDVVVR